MVFDESRFLFRKELVSIVSSLDMVTTHVLVLRLTSNTESIVTRHQGVGLVTSSDSLDQGTAILATPSETSSGAKLSTLVLSINDNNQVCDVPPLCGNAYPMITRAKAEVFKPRVLNIEL